MSRRTDTTHASWKAWSPVRGLPNAIAGSRQRGATRDGIVVALAKVPGSAPNRSRVSKAWLQEPLSTGEQRAPVRITVTVRLGRVSVKRSNGRPSASFAERHDVATR